MKAGETNAALAYYSKALELVPGDHLVLGNRAQAYIGIRCFYQAEVDCDNALAIEPAYPKARYRRAVAKKEQGKLAAAIEDLEALVVANPEHTLGADLLKEVTRLHEKKQAEEAAKVKVQCDMCGLLFGSTGGLVSHQRWRHSPETMQCSVFQQPP